MNNCKEKSYTARQPPEIQIYPLWFDGKKINEVLFCEEFLQDHPMLCVHDTFFTTEGRVTDETISTLAAADAPGASRGWEC